ncbi:MAG: hypothetical protein KF819_29780 [Labilithrix sp.]|nr:hypothetical protein [Labilithrix sp.]
MSKSRVEVLEGLTVLEPDDWFDITDELPEGTPVTLARRDGVGALQFSFARYRAGARPNVVREDLEELMTEFAAVRHLGPVSSRLLKLDHCIAISADFCPDGDIVRLWYATNGNDVVFATYTAGEGPRVLEELERAESIMGSLRFDP